MRERMFDRQAASVVRRPLYRYVQGRVSEEWDSVAVEYPLTIYLNGEELATLVCTPSHLEELAVGFLASEGIVRSYAEILSLSFNLEVGFCYVTTTEPLTVDQHFYNQRYVTSCCGKGRQSFYFRNDAATVEPVRVTASLAVTEAFQLMRSLQENSRLFAQTGGVHNAALCSAQEVLLLRSDVGRHNALDKLYGYSLMQPLSLSDRILAFSGRVSSEVILKVAKMRVGIVLSKSAPTDLALQLAEELGITVVGFIRGEQLNLYTHAERVRDLTTRHFSPSY